jgi:hypothetical protein
VSNQYTNLVSAYTLRSFRLLHVRPIANEEKPSERIKARVVPSFNTPVLLSLFMDSLAINLVDAEKLDAVAALFAAQLREHNITTPRDDLRVARSRDRLPLGRRGNRPCQGTGLASTRPRGGSQSSACDLALCPTPIPASFSESILPHSLETAREWKTGIDQVQVARGLCAKGPRDRKCLHPWMEALSARFLSLATRGCDPVWARGRGKRGTTQVRIRCLECKNQRRRYSKSGFDRDFSSRNEMRSIWRVVGQA